jgi:hypothetical protein
MKLRIDSKDPTYVAIEASKRGPIRVEAAEGGVPADKAVVAQPPVAAPADGRKAPPRLRKPSPDHDRCVAPTGDSPSSSSNFKMNCCKHSTGTGADRRREPRREIRTP